MEPIHLPYYHPEIATPDDAKRFLLGHMEQGSFILRRSTSSKPPMINYSLSVVYSEKMIHHVPVQRNGPKFYLVKDREFSTIDDLVNYYSRSHIPNNNYKNLRLLHGVSKTDSDIHVDVPPPRPPKPTERKPLPPNPSRQLSFEEAEISNISSHNFGNQHDHQKPARPPKPGVKADVSNAARNFEDDRRDIPLPLPESDRASGVCSQLLQYISDADSENLYDMYSRVDDSPVDRSHELIQMLNDLELQELQHMKCECGIYHKDSQLPGGWTVHRSKDPSSAGQLFFTSSDGVTTSWTLPDKIWYQLRPEHVSTLKNLADAYGVAVPGPVKYLLGHQSSVDGQN